VSAQECVASQYATTSVHGSVRHFPSTQGALVLSAAVQWQWQFRAPQSSSFAHVPGAPAAAGRRQGYFRVHVLSGWSSQRGLAAAQCASSSVSQRDTQPTVGQFDAKHRASRWQGAADSPEYARPSQRASALQAARFLFAPHGSSAGASHQSPWPMPQLGPLVAPVLLGAWGGGDGLFEQPAMTKAQEANTIFHRRISALRQARSASRAERARAFRT
jgi:hypothetical protein